MTANSPAPQAVSLREAVHDWIREDAPTGLKMMMTADVTNKLVARLASRASPADGVMVPREPTEAMLDAFVRRWYALDFPSETWPPTPEYIEICTEAMRFCWSAMLSASPALAATSVNLGAQNGPAVSDPSEYDECLAATSGGGEAKVDPTVLAAHGDISSLIAARCVALPGKLVPCPVCAAVDNERRALSAQPAPAGGAGLCWVLMRNDLAHEVFWTREAATSERDSRRQADDKWNRDHQHVADVRVFWNVHQASFRATPPSADADKLVMPVTEAEVSVLLEVMAYAGDEVADSSAANSLFLKAEALARLSTNEATATPADAVEGERS